MRYAVVIFVAASWLLVLPWMMLLPWPAHGGKGMESVLSLTPEGTPKRLGTSDMDIGAGRKDVRPRQRRRRVTISGPTVMDTSHTTYVLDRDITAPGTAFVVRASHVTLDLNGHTVVYNDKEPGEGVFLEEWWLSDVHVVNGVIRQGAANDSGDVHGRRNNPVYARSARGIVFAGLHLQWSGRDLAGMYIRGSHGVHIHHCTLEDKGHWVSNRHQTIDAINVNGDGIEIDHVLMKGVRQVGVFTYKADVHHNEIHLDSRASNSSGIRVKHGRIAYNKVLGRGENPIGFWPGPGTVAHSNYIDVQSTRRSKEYGSRSPGAAGMRIAWGKSDGIEVHSNTFLVRAEKDGIAEGLDSWGRGVFIGVPKANQTARFHHNVIVAVNQGRGAKAAAVGIVANNDSDGVVFEHNIIASNWGCLLLGDDYGYSKGFPVFKRNRIIRIGDNEGFHTIRSGYRNYASTALLAENSFENGAEPMDVDFELPSRQRKELRYARLVDVRVLSGSGQPLQGARLTVTLENGTPVAQARSDAQGRAELPLVQKRLLDDLEDDSMVARVLGMVGKGLTVHQVETLHLVVRAGDRKKDLTLSPDHSGNLEVTL
jgi:hypothetical protein